MHSAQREQDGGASAGYGFSSSALRAISALAVGEAESGVSSEEHAWVDEERLAVAPTTPRIHSYNVAPESCFCTPTGTPRSLEQTQDEGTQFAFSQPPPPQQAEGSQPQQSQPGSVYLCLRGCGVGLEPKHVCQAGGSACGQCGDQRKFGARSWKCGVCSLAVCPKCRRTGNKSDEVALSTQTRDAIEILITSANPDVSGADSIAFGAQGQHTDTFVEALLASLEQLPHVAPLNSYNFVPKSLTRRIGRLFGAALNWFLEEAAGTNLQRGRAASLFLRHLDFLIARDLSAVTQEKETKTTVGLATKRTVQQRVHRLEQGKWLEALADALVDAELARQAAARRRTTAAVQDAEAVTHRSYETCIAKTMGGSVRAGHRVLKSSGIHPASVETGELMASKFVTSSESDTLGSRPDLKRRARQAKAPRISQKNVSDAVEEMPDVRAPGCAGCRNSRLKAIVAEEPGLRSLTRWAQLWADGRVPAHMAGGWRDVLGIPLRKGAAGDDVRPILIGEALLSVPAACLKSITQKAAVKLLLPMQVGVGVAGAAEMMVLEARALAKLYPADAFCSLDMVNAFGEVSRAEVMEELLEVLPELAPFVLQLWGEEGTPIHVAAGAGDWQRITIMDGLFQGHALSSLLFCLGLRRALRRFTEAYAEAEPGETVILLAYIDDVLAKLNPLKANIWLPLLRAALATANLRLHETKTKVMIPELQAGVVHPMIAVCGIPQVYGHLELLGNVVDGEHIADITAGQGGPPQTLQRLAEAEKLADTLQDLMRRPLDSPSRRAVWTLVDKVLNKALDYDARIVDPSSLVDVATRLDQVVLETVIKLMGIEATVLESTHVRCLRLSTAHGGCGLMATTTKILFKKLTSACLVLPEVAARLVAHGCTRERVDSVLDLSGAEWCLTKLREQGIYVRADGAVQSSVPSNAMVAAAIPWAQATRLHAQICSAIEDAELASLMCELTVRDKARIRSCAGQVAGKWLSGYPSGWWPSMADDTFQIALRWRLGLAVVPEGAECRHMSGKGGGGEAEPCGARMDSFGDHCIICGVGAFRFARHAAVNTVVCEAGREAGYCVLEEQVVPEFCVTTSGADGQVKVQEARLDVEMFLHAVGQDRLIDGTVRHPTAKANVRAAAAATGAAAKAGVAEKARRYPPRGGREVLCCAAETYGHVDLAFLGLLDELAVLAAARQRSRGVKPTRWGERWRTLLSVRIATCVAVAILRSR